MFIARLSIASFLAAAVAVSSSAHAEAGGNPHVAEAREAIDNLEFDRARAALGRAARTGDNSPAQLAEIFLWSGVVAGSFGEEQNAFDFFVQGLTVDAKLKLPSGLAPKITGPFRRARTFVDEHGALVVACESGRRPGTALLLTRNDPAGLVFGAVAVVERAQRTERVALEGSDRFVLSDLTSRAPVVLFAVDRFGNRVSRSCRTRPKQAVAPMVLEQVDGQDDADAQLDGDASARPFASGTSDRVRPLHQRWYLWGGTSAVLAATGTYFGLAALSDQAELDRRVADSASYDFAQTRSIEQRGQRRALVAGVTLGAAAITAGVAVVMALRDDQPEERRATAVVAPVKGGASVGFSWSF